MFVTFLELNQQHSSDRLTSTMNFCARTYVCWVVVYDLLICLVINRNSHNVNIKKSNSLRNIWKIIKFVKFYMFHLTTLEINHKSQSQWYRNNKMSFKKRILLLFSKFVFVYSPSSNDLNHKMQVFSLTSMLKNVWFMLFRQRLVPRENY